MDLQLSGKNAVVTGASKGIGRSIALALATEGANVAICARGEDTLRATEKELKKKGVTIFASACDVGNKKSLDEFLDASSKNLGSVDILVNNVSALNMGDDTAAWEASITVDVMAGVWALQKVVPWMIESGGGSILFISSISGLESGSPPAYAAAKAAIISYSKTKAVELAAKNIRVNTLAPGSILFEGGVWDLAKKHNRGFYDQILAASPLGRMGTPEEIGNVAAFMVSPRASLLTGACVSVDGAQHKFNI